jgi:hypothetical protein
MAAVTPLLCSSETQPLPKETFAAPSPSAAKSAKLQYEYGTPSTATAASAQLA